MDNEFRIMNMMNKAILKIYSFRVKSSFLGVGRGLYPHRLNFQGGNFAHRPSFPTLNSNFAILKTLLSIRVKELFEPRAYDLAKNNGDRFLSVFKNILTL